MLLPFYQLDLDRQENVLKLSLLGNRVGKHN